MIRSPEKNMPAAQEAPAEAAENSREIVDTLLEFFLEQALANKKVGEGAFGVVLEANLDLLPEKIRADFAAIFPQFFEEQQEGCSGTNLAMKVIKIYAKGTGQYEYQMQERAREIISNSQLRQRIGVPRAAYHHLEVKSKKSQEALGELGVRDPRQIEVIIMDRVEGEDFEVITYRELIRREPDKFKHKCPGHDLEAYLQEASRESLLDLLTSVYGKHDGKGWDDLIKDKLRNSGVVTQAEVDDLRELLRVIHGQRFFHRDLHQGNLMRAKVGPLFVIDFDQAKQFSAVEMSGLSQKEIEGMVYEPLGDAKRHDGQVVDFLETMVKKDNYYITEARGQLEIIRQKIKTDKKLASAWERFGQALSSGKGVDAASDGFIRDIGYSPVPLSLDPATKLKMALMLEAVERGLADEVKKLSQDIRVRNSSAVVMANFNALEEFLTQ